MSFPILNNSARQSECTVNGRSCKMAVSAEWHVAHCMWSGSIVRSCSLWEVEYRNILLPENCPLVGHYAESSGNNLPTFRDSLSVPFLDS